MSAAPPIGYVKLHRKMLAWEWIGDPNVVAVFVNILLRVNREPKRWKGIDIPVGSYFTSRHNLALACGISDKQVRRALDSLEKGRTIERTRAGSGLLVTLVKWDEYQLSEADEGRTRAGSRADEGPQVGPDEGRKRATTKEVKKERSKEVEKREERGASATRTTEVKLSKLESFKAACAKITTATPERMPKSERSGFFDYWTEKSESGKMRFEGERYFDHGRRMDTWMKNANRKVSNGFGKSESSMTHREHQAALEKVRASLGIAPGGMILTEQIPVHLRNAKIID